jgi:hypothetical protein
VENPLSPIFSRILIEEWMLWVFFGIFLLGYAVASIVLYYHWRKYGKNNAAIIFAEFIFFLGTAFLVYLAVMGLLVF